MGIEQVLKELVSTSGAMLLEQRVQSRGPSAKIKVVVDTEEGIRLGQIEEISKRIQRSEAITGHFPEGFSLEVTSPGLDYPMTQKYQYERNLGRHVRIQHDLPGIPGSLEGVLRSVEDRSICLENKKGLFTIPFDRISRGRLVVGMNP